MDTDFLYAWVPLFIVTAAATKFRATFLHLSKWIDRICGSLFIALGVRLALSRGVVSP